MFGRGSNVAAHPHAQVLVVEDEDTSRRALSRLLNLSGFTTTMASSAEEALQIVNRDRCPEVALVDLDLPGMSGLELIALLRERGTEVYACLLTAASADRVIPALRSPVTYMQKPINFDELLTLLHQRLNS